jgi:hypothetical protein
MFIVPPPIQSVSPGRGMPGEDQSFAFIALLDPPPVHTRVVMMNPPLTTLSMMQNVAAGQFMSL